MILVKTLMRRSKSKTASWQMVQLTLRSLCPCLARLRFIPNCASYIMMVPYLCKTLRQLSPQLSCLSHTQGSTFMLLNSSFKGCIYVLVPQILCYTNASVNHLFQSLHVMSVRLAPSQVLGYGDTIIRLTFFFLFYQNFILNYYRLYCIEKCCGFYEKNPLKTGYDDCGPKL